MYISSKTIAQHGLLNGFFLLFFAIYKRGKGLWRPLMVDMLYFVLFTFLFLAFFLLFRRTRLFEWPDTRLWRFDGPLMDLKWHQSTRAGDAGSPVKHFFTTRTSSLVRHVMWLQFFSDVCVLSSAPIPPTSV